MRKLFLTPLLALASPASGADTTRSHFDSAFAELRDMLEGRAPISFERAVFVTENAYRDGTLGYADFQLALSAHQFLIEQLAAANNGADSIDFSARIEEGRPFDISLLDHTSEERRALYRNVLRNWAIFTHLTDTTWYWRQAHLPFTYRAHDPFGKADWRGTQVSQLLLGDSHEGNCFALAALFKLLSDRLGTEAYLCTAPQHIYLQHQDRHGHWYNVELASATHPGDGSIRTLTYTWYEGIRSGIALRRLKEKKQEVALCLVQLGKSHQHRCGEPGDAFALQCAELALAHDSLNLNAMLLRQQVLEEMLAAHGITDVEQLRERDATRDLFTQLEAQVVQLNTLGYHEMPGYMQEMILAALGREGDTPIFVKDRTPSPFTSVNAPADQQRYSTLSHGRFEEVHAQERYEAYGRTTFDAAEKQLSEFRLEQPKELLIDPAAFAWSVDPLAKKYPWNSPYAFVGNSPILNVEEGGAYFVTYMKTWDRFVIRVTNVDWVKGVSALSALPALGVIFEASLASARGSDPSFDTSTSDWAGLGLQAFGAGSFRLLTKLGRIEGLGKMVLKGNRELSASVFTALCEPDMLEMAVDYLAMKRLEGLGIGEEWDVLESNDGKTMTRPFAFTKEYITQVRQEILSDKALVASKGFDLNLEVENRLRTTMDESKEAIRAGLKEIVAGKTTPTDAK